MRNQITCVDLDARDKSDRDRLLSKYYDEVYREAFPKVDQAEGPEVWLPLMGSRIPAGQPSIHAVLAIDASDNVVGGQIFEQYRVSGCWLATYLAVTKTARGQGVGRELIAAMLDVIRRRNDGKYLVFAEAENPLRMVNSYDRAMAEERAKILDRLDFRRVPIDYVQPALGPGKKAPDDLFLLCHVSNLTVPRVSCDRVACFLREFYYALDQERSPYLAETCRALSERTFLTLKRLI